MVTYFRFLNSNRDFLEGCRGGVLQFFRNMWVSQSLGYPSNGESNGKENAKCRGNWVDIRVHRLARSLNPKPFYGVYIGVPLCWETTI